MPSTVAGSAPAPEAIRLQGVVRCSRVSHVVDDVPIRFAGRGQYFCVANAAVIVRMLGSGIERQVYGFDVSKGEPLRRQNRFEFLTQGRKRKPERLDVPEDLGAWFFCLQVDPSAGHADCGAGLPQVRMNV